ncbi:MAG: OB-fold nucleic acid binding domain-containing protein [Planctomycetota bacterium]|jgi:lysyl-tRNA synthetase class 2
MTEEKQQSGNKFEQQRREKLAKIREFDVDPYGGRFEGAVAAETIKDGFVDDQEGQRACCAGRIVLLRDIGKLIFITLRDSSGTIQLGLSKKLLEDQWAFMKLLDLGDLVGVEGQLGRTRTGEFGLRP